MPHEWLAGAAGGGVAANYPVAADGDVVIAGETTAPVAVDVHSDYMCPGCERFENAYRPRRQPAQGSAGLTDDPLAGVGTTLGATGDFAGCVRAGANKAAVGAQTQAAVADPALRRDSAFGTPTVTVNGGWST